MGWNSSTKVMSTPLSIGDIQNAVNCQSGDLGTCITTGSINEWSAIKPMRSQVLNSMTTSDREDAGYGFRLDTRTEGGTSYPGISASSIAAVFANAVANDGAWPYARPRGYVNSNLTEWFRMLDFNGYHGTGHSTAICPTSVVANDAPAGPNNVNVYYNTSAEIDIVDVIGGSLDIPSTFDFSAANVYVLYKRQNTSTYCIASAGGDISDLKSSYLSATVHYVLPGRSREETYDLVAVASDWNGSISSDHTSDGTDDDGYTWLYLPNTLTSVTVTGETNTMITNLYWDDSIGWANSFVVNLDARNGSCSVTTKFYVENALTQSYTISNILFTVELQDEEGSILSQETEPQTSMSLAHNASGDVTITVSNSTDVPSDATLSNLYLTVSYRFSYPGGGNETKYFDFSRDQGSTTQIARMSLAEIKSYYNLQ